MQVLGGAVGCWHLFSLQSDLFLRAILILIILESNAGGLGDVESQLQRSDIHQWMIYDLWPLIALVKWRRWWQKRRDGQRMIPLEWYQWRFHWRQWWQRNKEEIVMALFYDSFSRLLECGAELDAARWDSLSGLCVQLCIVQLLSVRFVLLVCNCVLCSVCAAIYITS